jgi:Serine hydroxymethyltransferase
MMDSRLQDILSREQQRQQSDIEMIASENYVSPDVMAAYANIFTNKYSEGYPGARYYGGQEYVDALERLTQYRALRMFGLIDRSVLSCDADASKNIMGGEFDESQADEDSETIGRELVESDWAVNVQPLSG